MYIVCFTVHNTHVSVMFFVSKKRVHFIKHKKKSKFSTGIFYYTLTIDVLKYKICNVIVILSFFLLHINKKKLYYLYAF